MLSSVRSVNSLETRFVIWHASDEYKEALLSAAMYENPRNMTLTYKNSDLRDFSNGNLVGKLFLLEQSGYIYMETSSNSTGDGGEILWMGILPSGIEYLNRMSYTMVSIGIVKQVFSAVFIAAIVVVALKALGLNA